MQTEARRVHMFVASPADVTATVIRKLNSPVHVDCNCNPHSSIIHYLSMADKAYFTMRCRSNEMEENNKDVGMINDKLTALSEQLELAIDDG
eukprot:666797-Pleurochrysis_carterae.AAC.1